MKEQAAVASPSSSVAHKAVCAALRENNIERPFLEHGGLLENSDLASRDTKMPDEEWIKTLEDRRRVKFIYQELPEDGAFITAQIEGRRSYIPSY